MIQRIQSIFLALAGAGAFGLFGLPFATTPQPIVKSSFFADSAYSIMDNPALLAFFILCGVLSVGSIFLYNNRPLQLKVSIFATIANILGIILAVWFFMEESQRLGNIAIKDGLGIFLPFIVLICLLAAQYYIRKDEKLVRSMDRLR